MNISKTALAAATSVAAVLIAGTGALAANFGILDADRSIAQTDVAPTVATVVDVMPTASTPTETSAPVAETTTTIAEEALAYQIDGVGVITLTRAGDRLEVAAVDVDDAWTWVDESTAGAVSLRLTAPDQVIVFSASVSGDDVVIDVVDDTPVPSITTGTTYDDDSPSYDDHSSGGDDYGSDDYDD